MIKELIRDINIEVIIEEINKILKESYRWPTYHVKSLTPGGFFSSWTKNFLENLTKNGIKTIKNKELVIV